MMHTDAPAPPSVLASIRKCRRTTRDDCRFSIVIPTWNNLAYVRLCVESIRRNSHFPHQIIVVVNEGTDGTLDWVAAQQDIDYVHAETNIGICYALNSARSLISTDFLVYANDDMYFLPDWDRALYDEIQRLGHKDFMLSCTMVEPYDTGNPCVVVADHGRDTATFDEKGLLANCHNLRRPDWNGSTWPPNILHIDLWDLVGGMSIEYSPGMYSDPDLSRKLWEVGVRYFKGKGDSLVYHFGSKSTRRVRRNNGKRTFLLKWGLSSHTFTRLFLRSGSRSDGPLPEANPGAFTLFVNKLKKLRESL